MKKIYDPKTKQCYLVNEVLYTSFTKKLPAFANTSSIMNTVAAPTQPSKDVMAVVWIVRTE